MFFSVPLFCCDIFCHVYLCFVLNANLKESIRAGFKVEQIQYPFSDPLQKQMPGGLSGIACNNICHQCSPGLQSSVPQKHLDSYVVSVLWWGDLGQQLSTRHLLTPLLVVGGENRRTKVRKVVGWDKGSLIHKGRKKNDKTNYAKSIIHHLPRAD